MTDQRQCFNLLFMAKAESSESKFIIGLREVVPLDDGGVTSEPIAAISNMAPEEAKEIAEAIYGVEFKLIEQGVARARGTSSMGYTGRWNTSWDPKGTERTDDGLVLQ